MEQRGSKNGGLINAQRHGADVGQTTCDWRRRPLVAARHSFSWLSTVRLSNKLVYQSANFLEDVAVLVRLMGTGRWWMDTQQFIPGEIPTLIDAIE